MRKILSSLFVKQKGRIILLMTFFSTFAFVLLQNIEPGSWLMGWDNLQADLYPALSLKRAIFSVWQEYQSFGLISGLAHASDVVRALVVVAMSYFMPANIIRYVFHISMLFLGGIGFHLLLNEANSLSSSRKILVIIGSLFYMFNLGTIQLFALPFEPFSIFFAALPFEMWIFLKIIRNEDGLNAKNLLLLFLINLLATPQSYVQTIFVVYGLMLLLVWITKMIVLRKRFVLVNGIVALILILAVNLFWLLPQTYFLATSSSVVKESKINRMSTMDTLYQNKAKGTFYAFMKISGFYYDMVGIDGEPLFLPWQRHFEKPVISLLPFIFILIVFLGVWSKWKKLVYFVIPFSFTAIVFLNATSPFSNINELLYRVDFIAQIFRTPFTKFIVPHVLFMSVFLVYGLDALITLIIGNNKKYALLVERICILGIFALIVIYSLPVFQGNLFSSQMKVNLPSEYLQVFDYFKKIDKSKRIALLPDYTYWGWFYHKWGYNGSGFLWYGIEQPIVSRTFDVWSDKSEAYYWEAKAAFESEKISDLERVVKKYKIDYFILDKSLTPVTPSSEIIVYDRLEELMAKSGIIKLAKKYDQLSIYSVAQDARNSDSISLADNFANILPSVKAMQKDIAYEQEGEYVSDVSSKIDIYYPFRDLESQTRYPKNWIIEINDKEIRLVSKIPKEITSSEYELLLPKSQDAEMLYEGKVLILSNDFEIDVEGDNLEVRIDKNILQSFDIRKTGLSICGPPSWGNSKMSNLDLTNVVVESNDGSIGCIGYQSASTLPQSLGYILDIRNTNIEGRRFFMYVLDNTKKDPFIVDRLQNDEEIYILPPRYEWGQGYSINFHNNSYVGVTSKNSLHGLNLYYFPYEVLSQIKFVRKDHVPENTKYTGVETVKLNYHAYKVIIPSVNLESTNVLSLDQSYHEGWVAYETDNTWFPFFGKKLEGHVLVNNWANGWRLKESSGASGQGSASTRCEVNSENCRLTTESYVVLFWPQYLQYLGFGILLTTLGTLGFLGFRNRP